MDNLVRYRREAPPDLGPILSAARRRAGLKVSEAAFLAGISRPHLSNMEAGRRLPSEAIARALADVLCLDDTDLARLLAVAVDDAGRSHPDRAVS